MILDFKCAKFQISNMNRIVSRNTHPERHTLKTLMIPDLIIGGHGVIFVLMDHHDMLLAATKWPAQGPVMFCLFVFLCVNNKKNASVCLYLCQLNTDLHET